MATRWIGQYQAAKRLGVKPGQVGIVQAMAESGRLPSKIGPDGRQLYDGRIVEIIVRQQARKSKRKARVADLLRRKEVSDMETEWQRFERAAVYQREVVKECREEMGRVFQEIEDADESIGDDGVEMLRRRFDAAVIVLDEQREELNRLEGNARRARERAALMYGTAEMPAGPTPAELAAEIVKSGVSTAELDRQVEAGRAGW
jgi:hypothetical protein